VTTRPQESSIHISWECLHWYASEAKLLVEEDEQYIASWMPSGACLLWHEVARSIIYAFLCTNKLVVVVALAAPLSH
jgi:hypothetical protein